MLNAFALSCGNAQDNLTYLLSIGLIMLAIILGMHLGLRLAKVNKTYSKSFIFFGVIIIAFIVAVSYYIDADAQVIYESRFVVEECPDVSVWDSLKDIKYGSAYFAVITPLTTAITFGFIWILRSSGKLKTYKSKR